MADVTEAVTQSEIADSLMGEETEQQQVEQPETEQQAEVQEESQTEAAEQQEQGEEVAEDWLPTEQDKVFPDEVLNRYATRYGLNEDALADPQLRQLLVDKINSDIYIAQQQQFAEPEQEQEAEPTRQEAPIPPEQYFGQLERFAQEKTSPEAAKWFHANFLKAFGVPDAEIAKIPPEQAIRFGQVATAGMANVANTIIDDLLQSRVLPLIEQAFPGFGDMYQKAAYANAWDGVRNSDPKYQTLPAFGTKEFTQTLKSASAKIPGFDDLLPENVKPAEAAKYYKMLAHFAVTGNVDSKLLQQAAAAGAKSARRAEVRRAAGNLGSGQSKVASGGGASKWGQSNQDLFGEDVQELYEQHSGRL